MDWVIGRLPGQRLHSEYEVWMESGHVRTCRMQPGLFPQMVFTDGNNPFANAAVPEHKVRAWRVTGRNGQQIAFEGKRKPSPPPVITSAQYQQAGLRNNPMSALYEPRNQLSKNIGNQMAADYQPRSYL